MKATDASPVKRRSFLKGAAVTTVAVSTGAMTGQAVAEDSEVSKPKLQQGYKETKHVKEYYRLARF